jgi:predicted  nucleic acid-binding Zn-ribbon protein
MSNNAQAFGAFIDLVNFDQKVRHYKEDIEAARSQIFSLEKEKVEAEISFLAIKSNLISKRKNVDELELTVKELGVVEQEKKKVLEVTSDFKEYKLLKSEIDYINENQQLQEQELIQAWDLLERVGQDYQEKERIYKEKILALDQVIAQKQEQGVQLENDLAEYQKGRLVKEQLVPAVWLEKYAVMQARVADPVVPIERGFCSSCFYLVTHVDMQGARHGGLVQCKGCFRLLYLPEIMSGSV